MADNQKFDEICSYAKENNINIAEATRRLLDPQDWKYWWWLCQLRRGNSPEHTAYLGARTRCTNPNTKHWKHYGGRGIEFRFKNFPEFIQSLGGLRPSPKHSVDRINNDGHYEPGNVRWATPKEQAANTRRSKKYAQPR
jgi:hypothetical protein